ncbi:MAG: hypothetical protein LLF92_06825 [Planctomycetaceae bacterium]|nr:hypothetical protein [Planctomycetaceae bacterium]
MNEKVFKMHQTEVNQHQTEVKSQEITKMENWPLPNLQLFTQPLNEKTKNPSRLTRRVLFLTLYP